MSDAPPLDPIAVQLEAVLERAARELLDQRIDAAGELLQGTVGQHARFFFLLIHEGWAGAISNAHDEAEKIIRHTVQTGGKSELPMVPPPERVRRWAETALPIVTKRLKALCPDDFLALAVWFEPPVGLTSVTILTNMPREEVFSAFANALDIHASDGAAAAPSRERKGALPS